METFKNLDLSSAYFFLSLTAKKPQRKHKETAKKLQRSQRKSKEPTRKHNSKETAEILKFI